MNMEKVEEGVRYLLQNYSMAEADMIASTVQDILAVYLDRQLSQDTEELLSKKYLKATLCLW